MEKIHTKALGIAHRWALFALANMAFAVAANHEEVYAMLNVNTSVSFIKKALMDQLLQKHILSMQEKNSYIYEVSIMENKGEKIVIATIHGYRTQVPLP